MPTEAIETSDATEPRRPSLLGRVLKYLPRCVFAGMHVAALGIVFFMPPSWIDLSLFFGLYLLRGFGLTAGFHRYFAHRAYQTSRVFQFCLGWFGSMAVQRGPMWWADTTGRTTNTDQRATRTRRSSGRSGGRTSAGSCPTN